MPFFDTALTLWTWPMQAQAAFWSAYWRNMSQLMDTTAKHAEPPAPAAPGAAYAPAHATPV